MQLSSKTTLLKIFKMCNFGINCLIFSTNDLKLRLHLYLGEEKTHTVLTYDVIFFKRRFLETLNSLETRLII